MLKERRDLEKRLRAIAEKINDDKDKINKIINFMKEHNISAGEVSRIVQGNILLESLETEYLYLYTKAFYSATDISDINMENWFTEVEISEGESYYLLDEDITEEIVLYPVTRNKQRHYVCSKIADVTLAKFIKDRILTYNIQTQRPSVKTVIYDTLTEIPDIRPIKTEQIKKDILNGLFTGNTISLNIRRTGKEYLEYDPETLTLRIPIRPETFIDIVDGAHRLLGIAKAVVTKPDLEDCMSLNILNYDIKEARQFIKQEGKASPLTKEQLKEYGSEDTDIMIAQDINIFETEKTNVLFNKLTDNLLEVEYRKKYTTYNVFSKSIKYLFEYNENESYDIQKVKENLVRGFNEILGYLKHKYGDLEKLKSEYVFLESNIFIGYISLLAKLWDNNTKSYKRDWDIFVHDILDSIDFSKNNKDWEDISLKNNKISKTNIAKISQYFDMKGSDINGYTEERIS